MKGILIFWRTESWSSADLPLLISLNVSNAEEFLDPLVDRRFDRNILFSNNTTTKIQIFGCRKT